MNIWTVPAKLIEIIDGDTLLVEVDLGWRISLQTKVRIAGINAPELSTPEGIAAKTYLVGLFASDDQLIIISKKLLGSFDKYGRILADISVTKKDGTVWSIADTMLKTGHAIEYNM